MYEPEPKTLVARMFVLGSLGFLAARLLENFLEFLFVPAGAGLISGAFLSGFLVVAPTEELVKLCLVYFFMYHNREFDEPMDGIVYSISCALGFATIENFFYMKTYGSIILFVRMFFSCFLHAACSGLSGYYLGKSRFVKDPSERPRLILLGLGLACLLHGLYDFFVFSHMFKALFLIIALLWAVKEFLDHGIEDALEHSPFRRAHH